jgi:hypothetical protein
VGDLLGRRLISLGLSQVQEEKAHESRGEKWGLHRETPGVRQKAVSYGALRGLD